MERDCRTGKVRRSLSKCLLISQNTGISVLIIIYITVCRIVAGIIYKPGIGIF